MSEQVLPGRSILNRAREIVHGARQRELYGAPERNLDRFARVVSVILGVPVTAYQAGLILAGLKLVRASTGAEKPDRSSLEDMAGYAELCALLPDPAPKPPEPAFEVSDLLFSDAGKHVPSELCPECESVMVTSDYHCNNIRCHYPDDKSTFPGYDHRHLVCPRCKHTRPGAWPPGGPFYTVWTSQPKPEAAPEGAASGDAFVETDPVCLTEGDVSYLRRNRLGAYLDHTTAEENGLA